MTMVARYFPDFFYSGLLALVFPMVTIIFFLLFVVLFHSFFFSSLFFFFFFFHFFFSPPPNHLCCLQFVMTAILAKPDNSHQPVCILPIFRGPRILMSRFLLF